MEYARTAKSLCLVLVTLLLASAGQFQFERCPDYTMWSARRPIESYWLVGREGMELTLPSLELALPLTEYDDNHI